MMSTNGNKDDMRDKLEWEEVSTKHIVQNEWIDFRESAFRFPDGTVFEPYYSYSRRDYVVIVPFDNEGNLICVKQYRQGIRQVTTEFPAGGIEADDGNEAALEAARRELIEETGYSSEEWTHLITIPSNATIADNYAHVYMATNCRKVSGQQLDETEFLNVDIYTPDQIEKLISEEGFQQSVHVMAYLLAKERLTVIKRL